MAKKDFAAAAENFSESLERFVDSYGQLAPECGEVYYQYGLALFREVEQQEENQDIFGSSVPKEVPTGRVDEAVAEAAPSGAKDSDAVAQLQTDQQSVSCPAANKKVEAGDDEGSESDKNNDGEEGEEGEGDGDDEGQGENPGAEEAKDAPGNENVEDPLQLAWEVLDTARTIFEKDSEKEIRLADTLLLLGDVNLRNEMFDNAVQDYEKCLDLRIQLLKPDDRRIMEVRYPFSISVTRQLLFLAQVHHQIAIAKLNYTDPRMAEANRTSAVESLKKAIAVCELRLVNLNKILSSDCVIGDLETSVELTSRGEIEEEINELEGIKV
jgi:tetratricopeptide (TPR) repeat protein